MSLQLIIQTDKEIKHLVSQFVGFIQYNKGRVLAFERVHYIVHHFAHRGTADTHAHALEQFVHEGATVPIFRTGQVVGVGVSGCIVLNGFRLAPPCLTGDGKHQGISLGIGQGEGHTVVGLRADHLPTLYLSTGLGGYCAPHFVADSFP